jgi:hypothetical protein
MTEAAVSRCGDAWQFVFRPRSRTASALGKASESKSKSGMEISWFGGNQPARSDREPRPQISFAARVAGVHSMLVALGGGL